MAVRVAAKPTVTIPWCVRRGQDAGSVYVGRFAKEKNVRGMGRLMQLAGLTLPIVAVLMQVTDQLSVGRMLVMAVAAISLFYIGRILEGYARQ